MWHMDDERLDAAIDEAAHRMTAGEPGAEFRDRVLARMSEEFRTPSPALPVLRSRFWPGFAAVSVAALVLLGVIIGRHPGRDSLATARGPQRAANVRAREPHSSIPERQMSRAADGIGTVRQERRPTVQTGRRTIGTEILERETSKREPAIPPLVLPPLDL